VCVLYVHCNDKMRAKRHSEILYQAINPINDSIARPVSTPVDRYVEFTKFMETILGVTSHSISEHRQRHLALTVNSPKDSDHLEISSGSSVGYRGGGAQ